MTILSGNELANRLRTQFPAQSTIEIAAALSITIQLEKLPLLYLAEVALHPPVITINTKALKILSETEVAKETPSWFRAERLQEVIIAHELYHILTKQPTNKVTEAQAHLFAQALTGLPFAPQVYEEILRSRFAQEKTKQ